MIAARVTDCYQAGTSLVVKLNIKASAVAPVVSSSFTLPDAVGKSFEDARGQLFAAIRDRFGAEPEALAGFRAMVESKEQIQIEGTPGEGVAPAENQPTN